MKPQRVPESVLEPPRTAPSQKHREDSDAVLQVCRSKTVTQQYVLKDLGVLLLKKKKRSIDQPTEHVQRWCKILHTQSGFRS